MSTTRTQKIVTAILAIYLILSPIAIGYLVYENHNMAKRIDLYKSFDELNEELDKFNDDGNPKVDAIHKKMDTKVNEAFKAHEKKP